MELILVKICPNLSNPCKEEECGQTYKKDLNVERCSLYFDYNCARLGNLPFLLLPFCCHFLKVAIYFVGVKGCVCKL